MVSNGLVIGLNWGDVTIDIDTPGNSRYKVDLGLVCTFQQDSEERLVCTAATRWMLGSLGL